MYFEIPYKALRTSSSSSPFLFVLSVELFYLTNSFMLFSYESRLYFVIVFHLSVLLFLLLVLICTCCVAGVDTTCWMSSLGLVRRNIFLKTCVTVALVNMAKRHERGSQFPSGTVMIGGRYLECIYIRSSIASHSSIHPYIHAREWLDFKTLLSLRETALITALMGLTLIFFGTRILKPSPTVDCQRVDPESSLPVHESQRLYCNNVLDKTAA